MNYYKQNNSDFNPAQTRKQIYLYLSNSFAYPEQELVNEILAGTYFSELQNLMLGLEIPVNKHDYFKTPFENVPGGQIADTLGIEYTRLFINTPNSALLVPPFESCYKNKSGLVMDRETISDLNTAYKQAGLIFPDDSILLPDHIAVELEFMSYLSEQEYTSGESDDTEKTKKIIQQESAFLSKHLNSFFPELSGKMKDYSNHLFYKNLAGITELFLAEETNYLNSNWRLLEKMEV